MIKEFVHIDTQVLICALLYRHQLPLGRVHIYPFFFFHFYHYSNEMITVTSHFEITDIPVG